MKSLKPFVHHGFVIANIIDTDGQAYGSCPFCYRKNKFYVNVHTQQWDCKVCNRSGNLWTFFWEVGKTRAQQIRLDRLRALAKDRGISLVTLRRWDVGWDDVGQFYTLPIYHSETSAWNVKCYKLGGKLLSSPGGRTDLFGLLHYRRTGPVWIVEGEWDAMVISEIMRTLRISGCVLSPSMGAGNWKDEWTGLLEKRQVCICYDHDDAGRQGELRVWNAVEPVAKSVQCVHWPGDLPRGFDVRDFFRAAGRDHGVCWTKLSKFLQPRPRLLHSDAKVGNVPGKFPVDALRTRRDPTGDHLVPWREVVQRYKRWLYLQSTDVLDIMFGTMMANRLPGDPVWMFLVGQSGACKSELLSTLRRAPLAAHLTTLTSHSLISGYGTAGTKTDPSLLPKLDGQVMIIKDFTPILQMNTAARDEIMGILRDAYDGYAGKVFGNGMIRQYESHFGILAGVTPGIDHYVKMDAALGERFLRFILTENYMASGTTAIARTLDNTELEIRGDRQKSMQEDLQAIAFEVLNYKVNLVEPARMPFPDAGQKRIIMHLAQWTAAARGVILKEKYTKEILSKPAREIGTRLAKQLAKLAVGISLVRGDRRVTPNTMRLLSLVARHTVPSLVEEVLHCLYIRTNLYRVRPARCTKQMCDTCKERRCATIRELNQWTNLGEQTLLNQLSDMRMLKLVECVNKHWRLTAPLHRLMQQTNLYQEEIQWKDATSQHDV